MDRSHPSFICDTSPSIRIEKVNVINVLVCRVKSETLYYILNINKIPLPYEKNCGQHFRCCVF